MKNSRFVQKRSAYFIFRMLFCKYCKYIMLNVLLLLAVATIWTFFSNLQHLKDIDESYSPFFYSMCRRLLQIKGN